MYESCHTHSCHTHNQVTSHTHTRRPIGSQDHATSPQTQKSARRPASVVSCLPTEHTCSSRSRRVTNLPCVAMCCDMLQDSIDIHDIPLHLTPLQHTATHCNTLQHAATRCNTLQHTATHCNTLQHTALSCLPTEHTCSARSRRVTNLREA